MQRARARRALCEVDDARREIQAATKSRKQVKKKKPNNAWTGWVHRLATDDDIGYVGTRQLTVNTCLVNVYDVLKPPCMAATVAYSNPMRRRPIVVEYIQCGLLIRARGC